MSDPARILIVDDEEGIRLSLAGILEDEGHEVLAVASGEEALDLAAEERLDLLFLDIWLPGMDGLEVLERLKPAENNLPVIMISGHGTIETAVSAIKHGAHDFIEKPLSLEKVVLAVNKALEFNRLRQENRLLRSRVQDQRRNLTGESRAVRELRQQIERVAPTEAWVLISGENGTGKEIVAQTVHALSRRSDKPLVAVNCAAIPEDLIENELFGHEKGAFTGAASAEPGKFEMANGGTLFLDEIGDMSLKTQAKILRILQEQRFERVGGRRTIHVNVRVIAATNKDLPSEIRVGAFREDLYYRLKVFPLHVPPLRTRREDIPPLVQDFIVQMTREHAMKLIEFTPEALDCLSRYPWPGNVRELKNLVERMLIMHAGGEVDLPDLPSEIRQASGDRPDAATPVGSSPTSGAATADLETERTSESSPETFLPQGSQELDFKAARNLFEARYLEAKLREHEGNVTQLAEAIGLERSYLYRKLKGYGIQP